MLDKILELLFSIVIMMWIVIILDIGNVTLKISNLISLLAD